jgi:hypothetical protein
MGPSLCVLRTSWSQSMAIPGRKHFSYFHYCLCYEESVDIALERTANAISQHPLQSSIPSRNCTLSAKRPRPSYPSSSSHGKSHIFVFEKDTHAYARDHDAEVTKFAKEAGLEVIIRMGRTLYGPMSLSKRMAINLQ